MKSGTAGLEDFPRVAVHLPSKIARRKYAPYPPQATYSSQPPGGSSSIGFQQSYRGVLLKGKKELAEVNGLCGE